MPSKDFFITFCASSTGAFGWTPYRLYWVRLAWSAAHTRFAKPASKTVWTLACKFSGFTDPSEFGAPYGPVYGHPHSGPGGRKKRFNLCWFFFVQGGASQAGGLSRGMLAPAPRGFSPAASRKEMAGAREPSRRPPRGPAWTSVRVTPGENLRLRPHHGPPAWTATNAPPPLREVIPSSRPCGMAGQCR